MPPPRHSQNRGTIAALITVAAVAAALFWVAHAIVAHNQLQNCIDSGRRTCLTDQAAP